MDAKEIKSLLKQARDAIKEKDHKAALKYCKAVLKLDKNNYNAWVFVGAAAQEIDQADQSEAAFKRAIEISEDQPLAWQGLCSFYEKHPTKENVSDLILVYKKLTDLFSVSDKEKVLEIYDKWIALLKSENEKTKLFVVLKSKLDMVKNNSMEEYSVQKQIFQEMSGTTKLSEEEKILLSGALHVLVAHDNFIEEDCRRIFVQCIDILLRAGEERYALSLAMEVYEKFPQNVHCLEFLSRVAMNSYIENGIVLNFLQDISEKLPSSENSTGLSCIFEGFCLFLSKNFNSAVQKIKKGLATMEFCVQGWFFLAKCQLLMHQYTASEKSCKTGIEVSLKLKASAKVIGKFYLLLGQALSGRENWNSALKALDKCATYLGQSKDLLVTFCFTLLKVEQVAKAEQISQELKERFPDDADVLQLEGFAYILKSQYEDALPKLRMSLSKEESSFTLHLIGLVLWETQQQDKAHKVFIKAVELDRYFAKNYLYLGHYFLRHVNDKRKACVCYENAFNLEPTDIEIGMCYSQVLQGLGKEEENMNVLKIITENSSMGSCKWAWTQLGLFQLRKNLVNEAISSLQNAVRADPSSSYGWECLADAYLKRGSYESALKAFEKVCELNPNAMYPLYQIATIQKMRGIFADGIEKFRSLLGINPVYVPALIGLAETLVLAAKKALSECLYGLTRDCCQEALSILARVASAKTKLACLWKLAGDACTTPFHLDDSWFPVSVPPELHQESEEAVVCTKSQLLAFGSKFFGRALLIKDNVSTLWHDLGVNCYLQSALSENSADRTTLVKKAFICLQKAVGISPEYEAHWTALGVVAVSNELSDCAFGQHAFIKSLELNKFNAETWTNLGVLYLVQDNIKLSHAAFKMAQSAEPTYPLSWVGQACIADKVNHSETLDLFRHATTLGAHNETLIGYARVVCDTLLKTTNKDSKYYKYNIEDMNAVMIAADCAFKYVANNCNCAVAFNMLGMLRERQGIYNASLRAYERSLKLLESSNEPEHIELVRSNYARLLSVTGDSSGAIDEFMSLKKVDLSVICNFALAMYRDKQYDQAFSLFKKAFEKCKSPGDQSHIKVAMAIVASHMAVPDGPNPLSLLVESAQLSPASVPGLLSLYAVGVLNGEEKLSSRAREMLHTYKYTKEYLNSTAFLWAAHQHQTAGVKAAKNELLKFLRGSPSSGPVWMLTASCLLQWNTAFADEALTCSRIGTFHGDSLERASQIFALAQMAKGYKKGALSAAQKAVHINPGNLSNWATLTAACHVADLDHKHVGWMFSFVRKLAKEQAVKRDFLGWFIVMEIFYNIKCGNIPAASALTNQALSITAFDPEIQSSLQVLEAVISVHTNTSNLNPLVSAIRNNPQSFLGWNVLCQLLLNLGHHADAEKTISHFAVKAEKIFPNWTIYPWLQLATLSYKSMKTNPDEREKWLHLGLEMSGKAVHAAPDNQAARFMHGLFSLESNNTSMARRSFERVLLSPFIKESEWMAAATLRIIEDNNLKRKNKE